MFSQNSQHIVFEGPRSTSLGSFLWIETEKILLKYTQLSWFGNAQALSSSVTLFGGDTPGEQGGKRTGMF